LTLNYELFQTDPTTFNIPNEGVAKIYRPQDEKQWAVLRYELSAFVCEGEYQKGLERVLSSFLSHMDDPEQPAAWVSGFYGSGKSHFVRVLEYLWRDIELNDGIRARGLTRLPTEIQELLKELTTAGKRAGGLWSAAGTLGASAGSSVRLALLGVVFRGADLPEKYPMARFVLWLRHNGYYQPVRQAIEAQGRDFNKELSNLYVSPYLANALLQAYPSFATNAAEARTLLKMQYPAVDDISDDELLTTLEEVLELQSDTPGKLPLTLLIFDELQQFLGEDSSRTLQLQTAVEACSAQFRSRLLFLGTGQASLEATPQLSKLQGRFKVRVMLEDKDVERVVREVVLRKRPSKIPELKTVLSEVQGEIDRHLGGTKIAPTSADQAVLVADYPLLPARRRFWELVLRAIDPSGTGGQLRTQLQIVHEANQALAQQPLGTVVPADTIYDQQKANMLQSGVLLREIANLIEQQNDGLVEGRLRARLCALIFLIGKLPSSGPTASGLRATPDTLADLLVEDLVTGSAGLRQQIPTVLQNLVDSGLVMRVGEEVRLQTKESVEWESDYRKRYALIRSDDTRIASDRSSELRTALTNSLKGLSFVQGASKTPRKYELFFGPDWPKSENSVPVWVRDEWASSEKSVRSDAQQAGLDSPMIFISLPRRDADSLRDALASYAAAKECIAGRPTPNTLEGMEARQAIESRQALARQRLDEMTGKIVQSGRIFQGGGNEISSESLVDSLRSAVEASLDRLYPRFGQADHPSWGMVIKRAQEGAADALSTLGFNGDADKHPVCQQVRLFIGAAGKKGSEVQKHFMGAGYGWSKDAVDGALLALLAGGFVHAKQNGQPKNSKTLVQSQIGAVEFYSEGFVIAASQRIAVRKLIQDAGLPLKPNEEAEAIPLLLQRLLDLAEQAGGPPPLPPCPNTQAIEALRSLSGNEQFIGVYNARAELLQFFQSCTQAAAKIALRLPAWQQMQRFTRHAQNLSILDTIQPQLAAIQAERCLLHDPDPLSPLAIEISAALRSALQAACKHMTDVFQQALEVLNSSTEWQAIQPGQRSTILEKCGITSVPAIQVGSDEQLLHSLDNHPLQSWESQLAALPGRFEQARLFAARLLEPQAVKLVPPSATLKTAEEADAYLANLRAEILHHLEQGKPVIL
jgi:hypothetical protein